MTHFGPPFGVACFVPPLKYMAERQIHKPGTATVGEGLELWGLGPGQNPDWRENILD
jgi:hypothetical protein